ncbi:MAG: hypothetical protein KJ622_07650 [Alphaproteobacteria bacterium]|nr:hypothetical protein [Alphaproteobacteria bacterium]
MPVLPNIDEAVVETAKISDYLLSESHPQGSTKAQYFMRFGFDASRPEEFQAAIMLHAKHNEVTASERNRFGVKHVIEGPLETPDGRNPVVRSIWFIAENEAAPRLVTVVPIGSGRQ